MVTTPPDQDYISDPDGDLGHVLRARYPTAEHAVHYIHSEISGAADPVCVGTVWMRSRLIDPDDPADAEFAAEYDCSEIWEQAEPHSPGAVEYWTLALSSQAKSWAQDGLLD